MSNKYVPELPAGTGHQGDLHHGPLVLNTVFPQLARLPTSPRAPKLGSLWARSLCARGKSKGEASGLPASPCRGAAPVPGAAGPDQLLREDLTVIGTASDSGSIICHLNYLLPCLPRTVTLPFRAKRAEPCRRAWQGSLGGRRWPCSSQAPCSVLSSLPQEKAFLEQQPGLLSHYKELES